MLLILLQICCKSDNDYRISTITIEPVHHGNEELLKMSVDGMSIKWRLVADPAPTKDLVVIVGDSNRPDDWYDYNRQYFTDRIQDKYNPPYYVVVGKSNKHSQTYETRLRTYYRYSNFPLYINPLPSVSVVGKGVEINTDTLSKTLPATTYGGHIIPKGHKFVRYRVGNPCGIDKEGNLLKRETRKLKK